MSPARRFTPLVTLAIAIAALYLFRLDTAGVFGPDEPRYLAIGRAMAQNGDLITPRLWGSPWFEKPPLLYWMTATGARLGLNAELSGRLPVALLSLAFLCVCFELLRREYSVRVGAVAAALLATSAGWLAYSSQALTDLPLAVCFSLAVLLALGLVRDVPVNHRLSLRMFGIGCCLGLGMLAKGLVPLVLSVPLLWSLRRYWPKWWLAAVGCIAVAGPWYTAVYTRNGWPFVEDFFLKQHFARLYSESLQHVQPVYYYVPILLAGAMPWTPLLGLLFSRKRSEWDGRARLLANVALFGLLFFTASRNKLPGYLLPLLPSLFTLVAIEFRERRTGDLPRPWWAACACLIGTFPLAAELLPQALAAGKLSAVALGTVTRTQMFYVVLPIVVALVARRSWVGSLLALCFVLAGFYLKERALPVIDRKVSARVLWTSLQPNEAQICDGGTDRNWYYGLAFYRGQPFPRCAGTQFRYALRSHFQGRPRLESLR